MIPTNKTKPVEADTVGDKHEDRGETFWILVYVFMAFAIFEVLCVALFFIYRHRRQKEKQKATSNATAEAYDNHGLTEQSASTIGPLSPPQAYPEEIELYENETIEPRYSSIQHMPNLKIADGINLTENNIPGNMLVPEQRSRQNSRLSQGCPIIVLPKDCVIVHTSGSRKSRQSRKSTHGESSTQGEKSTQEVGTDNHAGPTSEDNRSLYSWGSFSSCYRTSTDEDYVSGSNRANWEEDSLYEEPDKVIQNIRSPGRSFGLDKLFALQESDIVNAENSNENVQDADMNGGNANENADNANENAQNANKHEEYVNNNVQIVAESQDCNENCSCISEQEDYVEEDTRFENPEENDSDDSEHIYESTDSFERDNSAQYYENDYDLPEDALAKCLGKPNKFALKHVLHVDDAEEDEDKPSLNLGMEFVNNNEFMVEGEDVKLRPTRRSTLYLQKKQDDDEDGASSC